MSDATPTWLPVPGWDGYQVSDDGQVLGKRGWLLKQHQRPDGYMQVILYRDRSRTTHRVHWLVALAFIGPRPEGMDVLHGDDDPANNAAGNLTYGTPSQNEYDKVRRGRHPKARQTHCVHDHEFTPENTHVWNGTRHCRTCGARRTREHYRRQVSRKVPRDPNP